MIVSTFSTAATVSSTLLKTSGGTIGTPTSTGLRIIVPASGRISASLLAHRVVERWHRQPDRRAGVRRRDARAAAAADHADATPRARRQHEQRLRRVGQLLQAADANRRRLLEERLARSPPRRPASAVCERTARAARVRQPRLPDDDRLLRRRRLHQLEEAPALARALQVHRDDLRLRVAAPCTPAGRPR